MDYVDETRQGRRGGLRKGESSPAAKSATSVGRLMRESATWTGGRDSVVPVPRLDALTRDRSLKRAETPITHLDVLMHNPDNRWQMGAALHVAIRLE